MAKGKSMEILFILLGLIGFGALLAIGFTTFAAIFGVVYNSIFKPAFIIGKYGWAFYYRYSDLTLCIVTTQYFYFDSIDFFSYFRVSLLVSFR